MIHMVKVTFESGRRITVPNCVFDIMRVINKLDIIKFNFCTWIQK